MGYYKGIAGRIQQQIREFEWLLEKKKKSLINLRRERMRCLNFFSQQFQFDAEKIYSEHHNSEFKHWYKIRKKELFELGGYGISSDFDLETLYLLIRLFKPRVIVETGVLYGASSSFILEALKENGAGKLYSIDLPNRENKLPKDFLVRGAVKDKWELLIGDVKEELPKLLTRIRNIHHFHHDSLHTFEHMLWEYNVAFKYLTPEGILSSHDIVSLPFHKNAFLSFCKKQHLKYNIFRNVGIAFCPKAWISSNR